MKSFLVKVKINSSPFYLVLKILSIPELFVWIFISAFFPQLTPPLRVWLAMRMLHFFTNARLTLLAIQLTEFIIKLKSPISVLYLAPPISIKINSLSGVVTQNAIFRASVNAQDINQYGFTFLGNLNGSLCSRLDLFYNSLVKFEDISPQFHHKSNSSTSTRTGRCFVRSADLIANSDIMDIVHSPQILAACHSFFGIQFMLYQVNGWSSFFVAEKDPYKINLINDRNARYPHIDFACLKFLKLFVFLDPVTLDDGPFHYWPGSNHHKCRYTSDGRYSYESINSIFGPPSIFASPEPGSVFLLDSSNYHCDGIVATPTGYRRTIQFEYCIPGLRAHVQKFPLAFCTSKNE